MDSVISGKLVTSDKERIAYTHYCNQKKQAVVIAHGFCNSKDSLLLQNLKDKLIDVYDVIAFDFRGHGQSSGFFSWTSKEGLDLKEVLTYAQDKYFSVGLIAFSLGAAIAINLLAKKNLADSLVAVAAPSRISKIEFHFWKKGFKDDFFYNCSKKGRIGKGVKPGPFWLKKRKPIDSVQELKIPTFYIHGKKDWIVSHKHSEALYAGTKTRKKIKIINNGPHAEHLIRDNSAETIDCIKKWFDETMP